MEQIPAVSQEIEREDHVAIGMENIHMASEDIEGKVDALTEIRGKLERLSPLSSKCCIYRVPVEIHQVNPKSYTPIVVSIGPFHDGKRHLQAMEEHKLRYLQTFLNRTTRSLEDYFKIVRTWEEKARHCYAETIKLSRDEFVKMILVDGSFIVECLLRGKFDDLVDESDRLFRKPWMLSKVCHDMILLENQLPFFVLEDLFNLVSIAFKDKIPSFLELVNGLFISHGYIINEVSDRIFHPPIQHFVDFIRYSHLQSLPEVGYKDNERDCFPPSLSQLHEAGIKLETKTSRSLFDIKFTNGILEIPTLGMYGSVPETIFRNLIAFEECHCEDMYIFHYMKLFQSMIKTTKDADLLIQHRILTGRSPSTESTLRMFEKICLNVYSRANTFYFTSLSEKLHAYCKTPCNKWKASLKRDYLNTIFNTPWKILSVILALVILALTIIQAVCSLISL